MPCLRSQFPLLGAIACLGFGGGSCRAEHFVEFQGLANASAAVRVGDNRFIVGSDEGNTLRLYRADAGGGPLASFDANRWLGLVTRKGEADLEGAARIGEVSFWIGSHARNRSGEWRPDRQRLMALRIRDETNLPPTLEPLGPPITHLLEALCAAPSLARFHLDEAAKIAPEVVGGFNIEGLAASPDDLLWIGLRSPVPEGQALLIPLLHPLAVAAGQTATFGEPVQLDLGGRGVRDLVWTGREYFLIGGSSRDGGRSHLYRWPGPGKPPERLDVPQLKTLNPEAIVAFGSPEKPRLLILSDDGNRPANQTRNAALRSFRALWFEP